MLEKNEDIFEIVLSKMLLEINRISTLAGNHGLTRNEVYINGIRENIVNVCNQYVSLKKIQHLILPCRTAQWKKWLKGMIFAARL